MVNFRRLAPLAALLVSTVCQGQAQKLTDAAIAGRAAARGGSVDLVLYLTSQPSSVVGRIVRAEYEPAIEEAAERMRAVTRRQLPTRSLSPEQEARYLVKALTPEEEAERSAAARTVDSLRSRMVDEIVWRVRPLVQFEQAALGALVEGYGGRVRSATSVMNTLAITLPARNLGRLSEHPGIAWIDADRPGEPELNNHRVSLGLEAGFWPNGFNGGVQDVGVLDTGVQQNHPAFAGHRFESNGGTTDSNGHGTGIAGILASGNSVYRGMAWDCDTICVSIAGGESTSMSGLNYLMAGTTEKPENVNYSFGNGTANDTDYSAFDRFFDAVIDTFGVMVSKSTGNGGWGTTTITHPAPAYNLMASANMDDRDTATRNDDIITSSSSRGPTLGGRKKPDITAPGTNSMTTNRTLGFSNLGGTSSASPHTGGGATLLFDLGLTDPRAIKAVLLNAADAWDDNGTSTTADDHPVAGSLWTKTFGWGYLDLGEAYLNGLDVFVRDMPAPPGGGRGYKLFKGYMFAGEKSTLVWNRHVAYNGSAYPNSFDALSNLELRAWRPADNGVLATSASAIDNVEQIGVAADGDVVLKVYTTGSFDPDVPMERYALATEEGFAEAEGPAFALAWTRPGAVAPGSTFEVSVTVTNNGDLPAHGNSVQLSGATVVSGANPQPLPTIPVGESRVATWTVRAPSSNGPLVLTALESSDSFGETFTRSGSTTVQVTDVVPEGFLVTRGLKLSGVLDDLFAHDGSRMVLQVSPVFDQVGPNIQMSVYGTAPVAEPGSIDVVLRASVQLPGVHQTIELYDWVAGSYVPLDQRYASQSDTTVVAPAPAPLGRFVRASDRRLQARFGWTMLSADTTFVWKAWIDQSVWVVSE